ncbi:cytochrome P450 71A1-like [Macadamia integrifolia]|uniref:cytochrome P450 71A1-like n=1 Tax=Macadamia integrifolia TaxID=60698 RepID=UPI001C4F7118|nr:cytochrome P450 71A1-like [Macadamia integrifolia]
MALQEWMEDPKFFLLPSLLILSLLFLFKLNKKKKIEKEEPPSLPPSPPKLPIIGNLHQLGTLPPRSLAAFSHKYGPLMLFHFGSVPTLVVSSPEMATEITKTHDIVFANRSTSPVTKKLVYGCTDISFSPYGEYWRQLRKLCVIELFSSKRVRSFKFVREEEVAVLIEKISVLSQGGVIPVNISDLLPIFSSNVICRVAAGTKYTNPKLSHIAREVEILLGAFSVREYFPLLGWIDTLTGLDKRVNKIFQEMDSVFDAVIQDHLNSHKEDGQENEKDVVDLLLEAQKDSSLGVSLTLDNIKAIIMDMFIAGTDTSAIIVEWAIVELVRNPSIMKKAQEEIRSVVGSKSKIEEDDIPQMDYLKCIIKEIMRLHPPVPLLLPRESSAGVHIKGYYIPPKTRVIINAWAIQMDPKVWDNPEEFIPERFINNPIDLQGQDFKFLPFGAGRRVCPGIWFGLASSELVLANLLYWFDWECPGGEKDIDMTEVFGLVVHKKTPVHLLPKNHFS